MKMDLQQGEVFRFIKLLSDNALLKDVILIGSWAEYMYTATNVLPGYEANLKTLDMDFLIKNLRRPQPPVSVVALAKGAGYIVETDRVTGVNKISSSKGLEIEFLIAQKGSGDARYMHTNMGVTVQALRHMKLLKSDTIEVNYMGINVTIPSPEAFVLHKMVINNDRGAKKEKDQQVINSMYPYLDESNFKTLRESLTKKEDAMVEEYIEEFLGTQKRKRKHGR